MNEKDLKVAIDQLTAMSDFALDLRVKLTAMLNAPKEDAPAPAPVLAPVVKDTKKVVETPTPAQIVEVDLSAIAEEYELNSMKVGELREYLDGYEIDYPEKAKKPELIVILSKAIAEGKIPLDGDDSESSDEVSTPETPTADTDDEGTGEADEFEASDERVEAENLVEDKIRASFPKKLKVGAIKKFLKTYYDGDAEMADLEDYEDEQLLEMYIEIQQALVDDEGDVKEMEEPYFRDGVYFCCGKELVEMESNGVYCEVCGNEYK